MKQGGMQRSTLIDLLVGLTQFVTSSDVMLCNQISVSFTKKTCRTQVNFHSWDSVHISVFSILEANDTWEMDIVYNYTSFKLNAYKSNDCSFSLLSTISKGNYENVVKMML